MILRINLSISRNVLDYLNSVISLMSFILNLLILSTFIDSPTGSLYKMKFQSMKFINILWF
jgi:hypothetical protein